VRAGIPTFGSTIPRQARAADPERQRRAEVVTLVRKLLEMHGGAVQATSQGIGQGSEFVVTLPIQTERARASSREERQHAPNRTAVPLRIVVVDDNVDAAQSLSMVLSFGGHDIRTVCSATEALETAQEHKPDVMFIDIEMPGMNGYELAEHLLQSNEFKNTVLVATTGYGQQEARQRGMQAGFAHYLVKPIDRQTVEDLLASIPRPRQQA
jgi:CheY-like chemotaxis protein